ncbi:MAG: ABC transporter substrate-binding protein [Desulfuromonadaceae bacterium]|nr:ABC transporter substrate-binding protein [Desulfuromonadaceae bacterium]MDD5107637.1 ABC transporter substrate-binding protein [Desulfuromonadaceae bacterium]
MTEEPDKKSHLDFLAYPPCFLKDIFREGLDGVRDIYREETGTGLKSCVPPYCSNDPENIYSDIWNTSTIEDFPDAVVSDGFDDLFRKEFIEQLIGKGYFKSAWNTAVNKQFEKSGFEDPDYTVYAVIPFILFIDKNKLDGLPAPRRWSDLLEPQFRNKIIVSGSEGNPIDVPLLYFYKEHGEKGLRQLAANTKAIWHAARIARTAGTSDPSGVAVYIQSLFFAECCPRTDATSIVWPEDGACTSPLYLLMKESKMNEMTAITNYITGSELGQKCAQSCFLSLNPHVDNKLPENASFKWLGWDFIKSHDITEMRKLVKSIFVSEYEKTGKGGGQ